MNDLISVNSLLKNSAQIEFTRSDGTVGTYIDVKAVELEQKYNSVDAVPIEELKSWLCEIAMNNTGNYLADACEEIISRLDGLPTFTKRSNAHWKYWDGWMSNHDMRIEYECSNCGHEGCIRGFGFDNIKHLPDRCPSCKSKMDKVSA